MTPNPAKIGERGNAIYREKYQEDYESRYPGKYVAIDIESEEAFVADTPEAAIRKLQERNPDSFFHLIKVGSPGVFKVGFGLSNERDGLFQ
jgi:hypothetical protein